MAVLSIALRSLYGEHTSTGERERREQTHDERIHDDSWDILPRIGNLLTEMSTTVAPEECIYSIANTQDESEAVT